MRKGSFLPRYRCASCGHHWAIGGSMRDCPKCGKYGPHRCCRLGWSGEVHNLRPFQPTPEYAGSMYEISDIGPQADGSVNVEHTTVGGKGRVGRLHGH